MIKKIKDWSNGIFNNIGGSVKSTARILFWVDLISFWISGIIGVLLIIITDAEFGIFLFLPLLPIYLVLCIPVAMFPNMILYALGEIVDGATSSRALNGNFNKYYSEILNEKKEKSEKEKRNAELKKLLDEGLITEEEYTKKIGE